MAENHDPNNFQLELVEVPSFDKFSILRIPFMTIIFLCVILAFLPMNRIAISQMAQFTVLGVIFAVCLMGLIAIPSHKKIKFKFHGQNVLIKLRDGRQVQLRNGEISNQHANELLGNFEIRVKFIKNSPHLEGYLKQVLEKLQSQKIGKVWNSTFLALSKNHLALIFSYHSEYSDDWSAIASIEPQPSLREIKPDLFRKLIVKE